MEEFGHLGEGDLGVVLEDGVESDGLKGFES